jgi:micrococcal nuclease
LAATLVTLALVACDPPEPVCGPAEAIVEQVVDGDTIRIFGGETIRYILVDTPESTTSVECFGPEAAAYNSSVVLGRKVGLEYGPSCRDRFDRLLAFITLDGREVNRLLVERGYGCTLFIAPDGQTRVTGYEALEATARAAGRGLWGFCSTAPCGD